MNLFDEICSYKNLVHAWHAASRNKGTHRNVLVFASRLQENLIAIRDELKTGAYRPGCYHEMVVYEPKKRVIRSLPFRDRVVQHAIYDVVRERFERSMIADSYACRIGKGAQRGMLRLQSFLRHKGKGCFVLKGDVHHFFASVNHEALLRLLSRKVKDRRVLALFRLFLPAGGVGIPIGNLMSQLYANVTLDALDHYVKDVLGVKCYVRYMDDFVMVLSSREEAEKVLADVRGFLGGFLHLSLNRKTQIFPEAQGVNFLGYLVTFDHVRIRHATVKRVKRKIAHYWHDVRRGAPAHWRAWFMSFLGMAKWANCRSIEEALWKRLEDDSDDFRGMGRLLRTAC